MSHLFYLFIFTTLVFNFFLKKDYPIKFNEIFCIYNFCTFIYFNFLTCYRRKNVESGFISDNFYEVSKSTGAISSLQENLKDAIRFWDTNPANIFDIFSAYLNNTFCIYFYIFSF